MRNRRSILKEGLGVFLAGVLSLLFAGQASAQNSVITFASPSSEYSVTSNGATDVATGVSFLGENNVLFGGIEPPSSPGGFAATSVRDLSTYTLCDGCSINVAGKFYNRWPVPKGYAEGATNEFYLLMGPIGANPLDASDAAQGVYVGGPVIVPENLVAAGINQGDATQARRNVVWVPDAMPQVPNQWNIFSAQFRRSDVAGVPHLIVERALMNGVPIAAFSSKDLFYLPYGPAQFAWLDMGFNVGIGVDDYAAWMYATLDGIAIEKSFSPAAIDPGQSATLTLTVTNPMLLPAASLAFTDALPSPLQVGAGGVTSNTCGGTATAAGNTVSITGGAIPSASVSGSTVVPETCTLSVDVEWPAAATTQCNSTPVTNTIAAGDVTTDLGQNAEAATADIQCPGKPLFNVIKTVSDANANNVAEPGEELTYSLQVINTGNVSGAVTINDVLPLNTQFVSADQGGVFSSGNVMWTGITVPAATVSGPGLVTLTLIVRVNDPLPQGVTSIANQAVLNYSTEPALLSCPDDATPQPCPPTVLPVRVPVLPVPVMGAGGFVLLSMVLLLSAGILRSRRRVS